MLMRSLEYFNRKRSNKKSTNHQEWKLSTQKGFRWHQATTQWSTYIIHRQTNKITTSIRHNMSQIPQANHTVTINPNLIITTLTTWTIPTRTHSSKIATTWHRIIQAPTLGINSTNTIKWAITTHHTIFTATNNCYRIYRGMRTFRGYFDGHQSNSTILNKEIGLWVLDLN